MLFTDEHFMKKALNEAEYAIERGEVPVGAVIVNNNQIIAKAYNQVELLNDVTAHAEIIAMTATANAIGAKYLNDCTLYVTLEPCLMCAGASYWSQIGRIVIGARDQKRGYNRLNDSSILHPKTEVKWGVMEDECGKVLIDFFKEMRK